MHPTTNRSFQFSRALFLIVAVATAQLFIAPSASAQASKCPCTIFSAAINPGTEAPDRPTPTDPAGLNLGIRFHSDTAGFIKAIRFYKHVDNTPPTTGPRKGYLWQVTPGTGVVGVPLTGTLLTTVDFTTETAQGWQQATFTTPFAIDTTHEYVASYYAPNRAWPHNLNYFLEFDADSPPLHVDGNHGNRDGVARNGIFAYGASGDFPVNTNTDRPSNYLVDVVFDTVAAASTTSPTASFATTAVTGGVDPNTNVVVSFSKQVDANTVNTTNIQLIDAVSLSAVPAAVTYPVAASRATATLIPSVVLQTNHDYKVVVKGGASGVVDISGNQLAGSPAPSIDATLTFKTALSLPNYSCPCTIWTATSPTSNGVSETADNYEATLGVKFQTNADGFVKGIRFYKTSINNATPHHGYLFDASGTLLAKATFANESNSGWQEVRFATPVAVARHTTYIAAYYMPNGHWANSRPFFHTGPSVTWPLFAQENFNQNDPLQSNLANPNSVFVYNTDPFVPARPAADPAAAFTTPLFPNQDPFDAPNYWIDVVFDTASTDAPAFTSANATTFTVGAAGSFTVSTTGTPTPSIAVTGTLPTGVTFIDNHDHTATLAGTPAAGSGNTYNLTFTATSTAGTATQTFTLAVNEAPSITTAATNQTVCAGTPVTFSAAASGYPAPSVQWQVSTNAGVTYNNIIGATSPSFTFTPAATDSGNSYRAVFTNSTGTAQTNATLTVNAAPSITTNPSNATACANTPVTFTAAATGSTSVKWQTSTDGVTFTDIAGATTASYTFTPTTADNNKQYRAVFTNSCGSPTTTAATLTVTAAPAITTNPSNATACANSPVTFTAAASGNPSVKWQVSTDGVTFTDIAGATTTTYTFTTTAADNNKQFRAVFSNTCGTTNTTAATLTVTSVSTPTINPSGTTAICSGTTTTLTSSSATGNQWFLNGTAIAGATAQTLTVSAAGNYTVVVTSLGCSSAASAATSVTVTQTPATPTASNGGPYCEGATIALSTPAVVGATYAWTGPNTFTSTLQNPTIATATVAMAGTYSVTVTVNGCRSAAGTTNVVVNARPATPTATNGGPYCEGATIQLNATTIAGATYAWTGPAGFTSNVQNPTIPNALVANGGSYSVTATLNGCPSAAGSTTVVVNPKPTITITPTPAQVCASSTGNTASGPAAMTTYSWTITGGTITAGAATQTVTYTAGASGSVVLTLTASNGTCSNTNSTTIPINALPTAPTITTASPVCGNSSNTATGPAGATTYAWTISNGTITAGASSQTVTYTAGATGTVTLTLRVTNASGCSAQSSTPVTVNATPATPTVTASGATTFCQGGSVTLTSSALTGNQWFLNGSAISGATARTFTANASGSYTVTATTTGCTSTPSVATTVTVNPVPATPAITAPTLVQANSTGNTASGPAGATTYAWTATNGTITGAANIQTITFTAGASGNVTLNLTVTNSFTCSASSSATVPINRAPVANADSGLTDANTPFKIAVLANDTDADGDTLTVTAITQPVNGTTAINADKTVQYTPKLNFNGTDTFNYTISDGRGGSATGTVTVTVKKVNAGPTARTDAYSVDENTTLSIAAPGLLANDTDPDGDPLTATLGNIPSHGTAVVQSNGAFTYTPTANYFGPDTFTYKAKDSGITTSTDDQTIDFMAGNVDGCTATTLTDGDVTLTPNTASGGFLDTFANTSLSSTWAASSTGLTLNGQTVSLNNGGTMQTNATYAPTAAASVNVEFVATFTAGTNQSAGFGMGGLGSFLTKANWAIFSTNTTGTQLYARSNAGTDTVAALGATYLGSPHKYRIEWTTTNVTYYIDNVSVATQNVAMTTAMRIGAQDNTNDTFALSIDWIRVGPYTTPCLFTSRLHYDDGATWKTLTANVIQLPNTTVSFETRTGNSTNPDDGTWSPWNAATLTATAGVYTINSPAASFLQYHASLATTDGNAPVVEKVVVSADLPPSEASVNITVNRVDNAPVANPDSYTVCQDSPLNVSAPGVLANDTDADADPLTAVLVTPPAHAASFTLNANGSFAYTPVAGYSGPDSFTYKANDAILNSAAAQVSINVTAKPATPTASNGGPYCAGAAITLSTPAVTGATYAWTGPNGFTSTVQNPTIANSTTLMSGTYFVSITVNGCTSATGSTSVTVNAIPSTPTATNGGPYCEGDSISLSTPAVTGATYAWTGPNAFTSSVQNPIIANATTAMAGQYSVTVTVNGCPSAAGTTTVVVNTKPAAPVASNDGPYCEGATIQLHATLVTGATYTWTGPNNFTSSLQNPTIANATTLMAGAYSVTATVNGCASTSASTTVVVNAKPATPTPSNGGPYCEGATIQLSTPAVVGATYAWTGPNAFTSAVQNPTIAGATVASGGVYQVTVTTNGCASAAGSTTVVVNAIPATPTISAGTAPTTFCQGGSVTLTSSSISGNQWYVDGVAISGAIAQTFSANSSGNYTVVVTTNGCPSAPSAATSVTVVATPPTPTVSAGTAPTTFCQGGSITLTSNSTTGNQWYLNGVAISGANVQTYSATASGDYTVVVTANGCPSAPSAATTITVTPTPATPTITTNGAPTTFCQGGSVTLTSSSTTGNQWYLGGVAVSGANLQSYTAAAAGDYTVVVTANGCPSAPSTATTVTVTPTPPTPTISTGTAPTTFCQGGSVTLTSSSATGNQWYVGGVAISGAIAQTYSATASGDYTVVVTTNSCPSAPSLATTVTVTPTPAAPTITASATSFCTGGNVALTSSFAGANQWYLNGAPVAQTADANYVATAAGDYTVASAGTCPSTQSVKVTIVENTTPAVPTITASATSFCTGGNVALTSSFAGANQWYLNGAPVAQTAGANYLATAGGDYTVAAAGVCPSAQSVKVTIVQNTTPAVPTITAGATSFCTGGNVGLTSSFAGPNQWYLNGAPVAQTAGANYLATAGGDYTVAAAGVCPSAQSVKVTIVENSITPTPTITASATSFCTGGGVSLTSSYTGTNQWFRNGTLVSTTAGAGYTATAGGSYTVVAAGVCPSAPSAAVTITENTAPGAPSITTNSTSFCTGGSVTLTSSYAGPNQWYLNGVALTTTTGATYIATAGGDYTVAAATVCPSAQSLKVTITQNSIPPTPTITASATAFCPGGSVTLTSSSATGNQWYLNGVAIGQAIGQTYVATVAGDYTVAVTTTCASAPSAKVTITQSSVPATPVITAPSVITSSSTGNTASASALGATSYQWSIGNGTITAGASTSTVTFTAGSTGVTTLTVVASNASSCTSTTSVTITINHVPAVQDDSYTVVQGSTLIVASPGVLKNDSDADGNTLTPSVVALPKYGTLTLNNDGSFTYQPALPAPGYGPDSFTYRVSDGFVTSATATVHIDVYQAAVTQTVAPGATMTTDPTNAGATSTNPLQTSITLPSTFTGQQTITISTGTIDPSIDVPPAGSAYLNYEADITPQTATTADNPIVLTFVLDASIIPAGQNSDTIQVFRDGQLVAACDPAQAPRAVPAPCVASHTMNGTDVSLTIWTDHTSRWNFGRKTTNTAPVGVADAYSICAGGQLSISAPGVLANDTDADRNTLTAKLVGIGPAHALSFNLNSDGSFTYTPAGGFSGADSFTYTPNDGTTDGNTVTVTITVTQQTATITASGPTTLCQGGTVTLTASQGSTYSWSNGATTQSITVSTAGNYTVTVTTNGCSATSAVTTVTVNTAPAVTTNPNSASACANGPAVTFSAAATGTPTPTVQWQMSPDATSAFTDIPGATATSYSLTPTTTDSGKRYRAVFTNSCGSATTTAATLTVTAAPVITTQPGSQTSCGTSVTFSAAATGSTSVKWQSSTDGVSFGDIAGATTATYTFTPVATDNNKQYRAVFANSCSSTPTSAALLTVNAAPSVTASPASSTVCPSTPVTFTAAASGTPTPTVQWQMSPDTASAFSDIVGATATSYTVTPTAADNGKRYRAVFTNSCGSAPTTAATLTVTAAPVVTTQPGNQTSCGTAVTFTAAGTGYTSVKWQSSTDGVTFADIAGPTTAAYTFTPTATDNNKQYRAVFANSCLSTTTSAAVLTVNAAPVVTTSPSNTTACPNTTVTFTAAATGTPTPTVQWQSSPDGATYTAIANATGTSYSVTPTAADNGTRYRAVFTNSCGTTTTTAAILTVTSAPSITTGPASTTACAGTNASFSVVATGYTTVQWQQSTDNGVTFNNIVNATATTYSVTASATNNGNQFRAVLGNSCTATTTSNAATLTVSSVPSVTANPTNQTSCGSSVTFTAAATGYTTVQWQVSADNGASFAPISTANAVSYTFTPAATDNNKQYRAVFSNSCGSVNTTVATLTVNAAPAVTTNPSSTTVCANTMVTFSAAASGTPAPTVQWQSSTDNITYTAIAGATTATYSFTATSADTGKYYRAVFTNSCATATTTAATLTVNALPSSAITTSASVVENSTGNTANGPASLATYTWGITGGTITAGAGTASITYTAGVAGTLTLTLTTTNASGCTSTKTSQAVTVTSATPPAITAGNVIMQAPAKGLTTTFPFHLTLDKASTQTITVGYFTSNQTAIAGTDYVAVNSTATFGPGVTDVIVNVTVMGTGSKTQKQFLLNLQNPTNATIAIVSGSQSRGTGVIQP